MPVALERFPRDVDHARAWRCMPYQFRRGVRVACPTHRRHPGAAGARQGARRNRPGPMHLETAPTCRLGRQLRSRRAYHPIREQARRCMGRRRRSRSPASHASGAGKSIGESDLFNRQAGRADGLFRPISRGRRSGRPATAPPTLNGMWGSPPAPHVETHNAGSPIWGSRTALPHPRAPPVSSWPVAKAEQRSPITGPSTLLLVPTALCVTGSSGAARARQYQRNAQQSVLAGAVRSP